jgi:hypothetical protein
MRRIIGNIGATLAIMFVIGTAAEPANAQSVLGTYSIDENGDTTLTDYGSVSTGDAPEFGFDVSTQNALAGDASVNGEVAAETAPLFFLDGRTLNPLEVNDNGTAVLDASAGPFPPLEDWYTKIDNTCDGIEDVVWFAGGGWAEPYDKWVGLP